MIAHQFLDIPNLVRINAHVNSRDIIKALEADGWMLKRVTGSHHHFMHPSSLA